MKVEAGNLQAGQIILTEYGDYGNYVRCNIDSICVFASMITARCHTPGGLEADFSWRPDELVEVDG